MGRFKPLPPGGERNGFKNPTITRNALSDAEFEKEVKTKLEQFKKSDSKEMILPPMDRTCRKKCHEIACMMGLLTRSSGEEPDRKIMLTKRIYGRIIHKGSVVDNNPIELTPKAKSAIETLIEQHPISEDDVDAHLFQSSKAPKERKTTVEFRGSMLIPPAIPDNPLHSFRRKLPSFAFREEIIQSVRKNTVVIITGGTGCGKTTQVPQFLLEDALSNHEKIRIFCTQPRRLPAIAISERVAKERDENIGKTVGYHIRLEQKTSPQTILTYCTSGVLLRMLSHDPTAKGISHIILDEVHERETNTDYLLIALKHALRKRNDLKVILMSATLEGNLALFKNYFDAPVRVVQIESKWFDVQRFYADDVLAMVGYVPPKGMFDTVLTVAGSDFPVMDSWTGAPEKAEWTASSSGKTHWEPPHMHQAQTMPNLGRGYVQDVENFYPPQHPSMSSNDLNHVEQHQNYMNMAHKLASSQSSTHLSYTQPVQPFAQMSVSHDHYPMQQCSFYQNHMPVEGPYRQGQQQIFEKWTAGPYVMDDGFVVSEDYMNHMQTQMGFYEHPMQAVPVQNWQNDGQQTQYVDYGSSSYSNGHYLASYPSANGRANEPMFYVPSTSDSASNQMSYPAPQKNETQPRGLSGFGASDFGESMRKQQELADRYRYDLKTLLPKKPSHFEPSVVSMIKNNRRLIDSANLYYKYRAVGAETWAQGVDPDLTFSLISYLVCSPIKGAILVFLPGYEDIQAQRDLLYSYKPDGTNGYEMIEVYLLHSQMNSTDQQKVFDRRPSNIRKIILSTNISEASLTIDDVVFVIDTGKVKEKVYDHNMKFSQLKTTSIAKSNAEQRAGRAGRCSEGYCFRLYSRKEYDAMPTTQIAEMQRSAIHDVCLHAKMFAPDRIRVADFLKSAPEPPSEQSIEQSLEFLEKIGALYSEAKTNDFFNDLPAKEEPQLTDLGRLIAHMPLEPQLARLLVFGVALKCLTPIVGLVAILSNRDPFIIPGPNERESANRSRDSFARRDFSDHLMLIRLLDEYIRVPMREQQRFCRDNFLNFSSLRMIFGIRRQLLLELYRAKLIDISDPNAALKDFNYNLYSECWPVVQAAIVAGCYPNIGIVKNQNKLKKIQTLAESNATLHPSSIVKRQVLNKGKRIDEENEPSLEFLAFHELAMIDEGLTVRNVTVVPSATVTLFSGAIRLKHSIIHDFGLIIGEFEAEMPPPKDPEDRYYDNSEYYEIEPWYSVKADRETLQRLLRLRFKFMEYFLEGLQNPTAFSNTSSEHSEMLEAVKSVVVEMHKKGRFSEAEMPHVDLAQRRQPPSQSNTKEVEQKIPPVLADIFNAYPKSSAKRNEKNGFTREKLEPMPQVKPKAQENGKAYRQKEQNSWKLEYPNTSLERPGSSSAKPSKQKGSERWPEKYGNGKAARQKAVDEWKPDHPEEMIDWQGGQGSRPSKQRDPERWPESQGNGRMSSQKGSNEWKPDHPKDKYDWQGDHGHAKNSKQRESDNWKSQKGSFDWQENQGKSSRQKEHYYDERGTKDYFEENGQGRASRNKYQEKRKPEPFRHPENYQEEPYQRDRWSQDDRGREEEFPRSKGQDNWRYREDPYYEPPEKFIDPGISKILEVVNKLEGNRPGTSYRKESSRQSDVRHGGDDRNGNNRRTNGPLSRGNQPDFEPEEEEELDEPQAPPAPYHRPGDRNRRQDSQQRSYRPGNEQRNGDRENRETAPSGGSSSQRGHGHYRTSNMSNDGFSRNYRKDNYHPNRYDNNGDYHDPAKKKNSNEDVPRLPPKRDRDFDEPNKGPPVGSEYRKTRGGGPSRQNDRGKYRDRNRNSENEKNPRNGSKKGPYYHD